MLDHTLERANAAGVSNINATGGDARRLPYPDGHFHAAYMMTVFGETADQDQARSLFSDPGCVAVDLSLAGRSHRRVACLRGTRPPRRLAMPLCQPRMLTARETTRPTVTSAMSD